MDARARGAVLYSKMRRSWSRMTGPVSKASSSSSTTAPAKASPPARSVYYLSSLSAPALTFMDVIRSHWQVENNLHWVLDVIFNEDKPPS